MNRYEIQIKVGDAWMVLDYPGEDIAITYQVNTLATLADRNSSYSQSIKLPASKRNIGILGMYLRPDVRSDMAYKYIPCNVYCNGILICPRGSSMKIVSTEDTAIEVQVVGPIGVDVDKLNALELNAKDAPAFQRMCSADRVVDSWDLTDGGKTINLRYFWNPLIATQKDNNSLQDEEFATKFYPALNFKQLVDYAFGLTGKTVRFPEGGMRPEYENHYIVAAKPVPVKDAKGMNSGQSQGTAQLNRYVYGTPSVLSTKAPGMTRTEGNYWFALIPYDGTFHFQTDVTAQAGGTYTTRVRVLVETLDSAGAVIDTLKDEVLTFTTAYSVIRRELSFDAEAGQIVRVSVSGSYNISGTQVPSDRTFSALFQVDWTQPEEIDGPQQVGVVYDLFAGLGFEYWGDLVKEFLNCYGFTVGRTGDDWVELNHYDEIGVQLQSPAYFVDLSRQILPGGQTHEFSWGSYNQNNIISLQENDREKTAFTDRATLTIANKLLGEEGTIQDLKFMSLKGYGKEGSANLGLYKMSEDSDSQAYKYEGASNPIILRPLSKTRTEAGHQGLDDATIYDPTLHYGGVVNASIFADYWRSVFGFILGHTHIVTAKANLNPVTLANLDFFTPVYLAQWGRFFQVLKISNYTPGKLTTIELALITNE